MEAEVGNVHCLQIVGKANDGQNRVLVARHFDGSTRDEQVHLSISLHPSLDMVGLQCCLAARLRSKKDISAAV